MRSMTRSAFFVLTLLMASLSCNVLSTPVPPTETPSPIPPTFTPKPTATKTPRPTPTRKPLTYNDIPCSPWTSVTEKDIEKHLCVYGIIYNFAPSYDKWYTVEFSSAPDSFRIYDFNYYYLTPLHEGDCIVIYGRIRDWGPFLIISPDFESDKSVRIGDAAYCE
jgi:hypothetical protein